MVYVIDPNNSLQQNAPEMKRFNSKQRQCRHMSAMLNESGLQTETPAIIRRNSRSVSATKSQPVSVNYKVIT